MTLLELQDVLGDRIRIAADKNIGAEQRKKESEISQVISSLAKQMINNADIVIRADRLRADGKIRDANIMRMIRGEGDERKP